MAALGTPPQEFHAFFQYCRAHAFSPASCLDEGGAPMRLPAGETLREAREEEMFRLRMPLVFADIAACLRRDQQSGEMGAALYTQCLEGALERRVLRWLDSRGYNLDWLFFGVGAMRREGCRPAHMLRDGTPAPLDGEMVRAMRAQAPGWTGQDWAWLHGGRFLRRRAAAPSMAITARVVTSWAMPPLVPETPDPAAFCRRAQSLAATIDTSRWRRDDWHGYVIRRLQASPARAGMLAGLAPVTTGAYISGRARPSACAARGMLVLDLVLARHGRDGLLDLLEILDEEARSRGFADLGEVFRARAWTRSPGERADAAHGEG